MRTSRSFLPLLLGLFAAVPVSAQTGRIVGTVSESGSGNTLPGANVLVQGTTIGAATDVNGRFVIAGAPAGAQTVIASFVGFQSDTLEVVVPDGGEVTADFALAFGSGGIAVEVTGQALGQQTAIQQQLSAETITNVVSAERIRELPDEDAATAVSRLPGVSLQNGDQIVVRGIEAKFNTVTVNGVQLPSTTTDRSTSLGFISSNMLAGIEVAKAVTPAMDANTIGGNVNLRLQEAPEGLHYDTMVQGDYNDQDRTANNYRAWASVSNRFFADRLGVFVQGNARRLDGGGDIASAGWEAFGTTRPLGLQPYGIRTYSFQDQINVQSEVGGSLLLDYRLPAGKLILQNAYSSEDFDNASFTDRLVLTAGNRELQVNRTIGSRYLLVNSLQGEHQFPSFNKEAWLAVRDAEYAAIDLALETGTIIGGPVSNEGGPASVSRVGQNQPNPFSAATTIEFELLSPSRVQLDVFDMLGRHVTTLVDEDLGAGVHTATWTADESVSSGVYVYTLRADNFVQSKRMVVVR